MAGYVKGNDVPTSVCSVGILGKEAVINEVLKCLTKYGLSKKFEITDNVLEHPKVWRIWDEALKRYENVKLRLLTPKLIHPSKSLGASFLVLMPQF